MGGVVRSRLVSSKVFRAAAYSPPDFAHVHINTEETFTFQVVLQLSVDKDTE